MKISREHLCEKLANQEYDLLIVGGGITGVGIALDAANRGLKVALIEMNDFASGTSSRSTKLIHGGLRYLKQFDFKLVNEIGRERAIVHKIAPHLVHPDKMLLPLVKGGNYGAIITSFGLALYDWLADVDEKDKRKMLSKEETSALEPLLRHDILEGGGFYAEYRTDDARLVMGIARTAIQEGGDLINYTSAKELIYENGKVVGVKVFDSILEKSYSIKSKCTVNATGPWVDELREWDKSKGNRFLHLTKGVHLVLKKERIPIRNTVYFDNLDGRMIFAVPRAEVVYLGTTDTNYQGDKLEPEVTEEDVKYVLAAVNHMFPKLDLIPEDVESSWAGLRPLIHEQGKSPSELSRKDEIFNSPTGLISIAGGKLTGYRKMAERLVDLVYEKLHLPNKKCNTDKIQILGGDFKNYTQVQELIYQISDEFPQLLSNRHEEEYLVYNYGTFSREISQIAAELKEEGELAIILAEAEYTIANEMVESAVDFFNRRTGRLYFNIDSVRKYKEEVIDFMAIRLDWSAERKLNEMNLVEAALNRVSGFGSKKKTESQ